MRTFNVALTAEEIVWLTWRLENEKHVSIQNWGRVGFYNNFLHKIKPENVSWVPGKEVNYQDVGGSGIPQYNIDEFLGAVSSPLQKFIEDGE